MNQNNPYSQYKSNSINFASKEQLLLMILDGAVKFSKIGRKAILDRNIELANVNIKKTQDIFYELIYSLDLTRSGEWGKGLASVYKFIVDRLVQANIKKSVTIMDEVIPLIEEVKTTWNEAYVASKK